MQPRYSNRAIIGIGLVVCVIAAIVLAYLLGWVGVAA